LCNFVNASPIFLREFRVVPKRRINPSPMNPDQAPSTEIRRLAEWWARGDLNTTSVVNLPMRRGGVTLVIQVRRPANLEGGKPSGLNTRDSGRASAVAVAEGPREVGKPFCDVIGKTLKFTSEYRKPVGPGLKRAIGKLLSPPNA